MKLSETQIENQVAQWLDHQGATVVKTTPTGYYDPKRKVFRRQSSKYFRKGISDLLVWLRGKMYALEVKTAAEAKYVRSRYQRFKTEPLVKNKKQKHLQNQVIFLEDIRRQGFVGEFIGSLEEAIEIINDGARNLELRHEQKG